MHEYSLTDHPRHKIIFGLAVISGFLSNLLSGLIQSISELLSAPILATFTVSGFMIFGLLYLFFNIWIWKLKWFKKIFQIPDLNGTWECEGISHNISLNQRFDWKGEVTIRQSWDKILICLETEKSRSQSESVVGGIKYIPGVGHKLSYHYINNPGANTEEDLRKHEGYCILTFSEDGVSAHGSYFNNIKDRKSYGEMNLKRRD